ncbi:MAG: PDZ domain-containing protein [Ruminococcaceae bacterium]|nr:PDZ domain-containing protein [Oscillospiraceae bacterium]
MEEEKRTEDTALSGEPSDTVEQVEGTPRQSAEADPDAAQSDCAAEAETVAGQDVAAGAQQPCAKEATLNGTAWDFGGQTGEGAQTKGKRINFFAVFGMAFGVCMLLFVLVLFLGDGKFEIIRNVLRERIVYVRQDDGTSGLLTPNEAADKVKQSAVSIVATTDTGSSIGSGFVYSADGYIITNYHVIEKANTVQVILPDGLACDATVRGYNIAADVAVLKIEASDLVPAAIGQSADLLVGDAVVAIGTPAKLDYAATATFGTVSATRRLVSISNDSGTVSKKMTLIQTDTSVNPGNSGGPLADMYGNVIGVVVMKITDYGGIAFEGIGFALPIDGVKLIAEEIIAKGSFSGRNPIAEGRSLLGVTGHGGKKGLWYADVADANGSMAASETEKPGYHYMAENGIYVMGVNSTNSAGKVEIGDIILAVNGLRVGNTVDLIAAVNRCYAGERVTLTILRNGQEIKMEILLYEEALY